MREKLKLKTGLFGKFTLPMAEQLVAHFSPSMVVHLVNQAHGQCIHVPPGWVHGVWHVYGEGSASTTTTKGGNAIQDIDDPSRKYVLKVAWDTWKAENLQVYMHVWRKVMVLCAELKARVKDKNARDYMRTQGMLVRAYKHRQTKHIST